MSLFKPVRWVASSLFGKKGRDLSDRYKQEIEEVAALFPPLRLASDALEVRTRAEWWAMGKGIPPEHTAAFADMVLEKMKP